MRIFYKNGFYFEGINNIPDGAKEITQEYYNSLLEDMSKGRTIKANNFGHPISVYPLEVWKEEMYSKIENDFEKVVKTQVQFPENGLYYLPSYANDYMNLLPKYFDESVRLEIWDASGEVENVRKFNKEELIRLIKFLSEIYEKEYQIKKKKKSYVSKLQRIKEDLDFSTIL